MAFEMTDADKAVSFKELRKRLYFGKHIQRLDVDETELRAALRSIPHIESINVLHYTVGSDAVWAAHQVLARPA